MDALCSLFVLFVGVFLYRRVNHHLLTTSDALLYSMPFGSS